MKTIRALVIAVLIALGIAIPVLSSMLPAAQPSQPAILRVADQPTPTPPRGPCPGQGC